MCLSVLLLTFLISINGLSLFVLRAIVLILLTILLVFLLLELLTFISVVLFVTILRLLITIVLAFFLLGSNPLAIFIDKALCNFVILTLALVFRSNFFLWRRVMLRRRDVLTLLWVVKLLQSSLKHDKQNQLYNDHRHLVGEFPNNYDV